MPASPRHRFIRLVVLAYCVLAALWILLSDSLLLLVADADSMVVLSTYKGLVFVLGTAALLYFRWVPCRQITRLRQLACWKAGQSGWPNKAFHAGWLICLPWR